MGSRCPGSGEGTAASGLPAGGKGPAPSARTARGHGSGTPGIAPELPCERHRPAGTGGRGTRRGWYSRFQALNKPWSSNSGKRDGPRDNHGRGDACPGQGRTAPRCQPDTLCKNCVLTCIN